MTKQLPKLKPAWTVLPQAEAMTLTRSPSLCKTVGFVGGRAKLPSIDPATVIAGHRPLIELSCGGLKTDLCTGGRSSGTFARAGLHGGQRAAGGLRSRVGAGCP